MNKKLPIIMLSLIIAIGFTSGGYGYWQKKLVIESDIQVIENKHSIMSLMPLEELAATIDNPIHQEKEPDDNTEISGMKNVPEADNENINIEEYNCNDGENKEDLDGNENESEEFFDDNASEAAVGSIANNDQESNGARDDTDNGYKGQNDEDNL